MKCIEIFESLPEQTVKTFNETFTNKIKGFSDNTSVEIGTLTSSGDRIVVVGDSELVMDLQARNSWAEDQKKKKKPKKPSNLKKSEKVEFQLSPIFKMLSPSEFFVYSAIKEAEVVSGVEELSRQINITNKTIFKLLKRLVKLGLVKKTLVSCDSGCFNELRVDTQINLH